jgi:ABC-2 type transport system permease protein
MTVEAELLDTNADLIIVPYSNTSSAREAFIAGEIGGYLVIPEGYFDGEGVTYFADENPGEALEDGLAIFLQRALLGESPDWVIERLQDPAVYTYVAQATGEAVSEGPSLIIRLLAPGILALVYSLAVFMGASQMGSAIIREKEHRAMEMVVTSLRASELVAGKVLGMTLLSLTQFGIWTLGALVAGYLAFSGSVELDALAIPWASLLWGLVLIVPAYFVFSLLAAGAGIIGGDNQQAQQLAGIVGVVAILPIWLLAPIIENPDGGIAVGLTLFPLTAPGVALLRMIFTEVPLWQLVASLVILLLTLIAAIWFVAKIFRAAMLNYGQTLNPRQLWQVLTQA